MSTKKKFSRWFLAVLMGAGIVLAGSSSAAAAPEPASGQVQSARVHTPAQVPAPAAAGADQAPRECTEGSVDVKDSQGLCVDRYRTLPIDRGDVWTAEKIADAWVVDLLWGQYVSLFQSNISTIDWLYGYSWVNWISDLVRPVAQGISKVINALGVVPFAMSLSALVYMIAWFRGNRSRAFTGIFLIIVVATLSTYLATPDKYFFGDSGLFPKATAFGNELVTAATSSDTDPYTATGEAKPANEVLLKDAVGPKMVDVMIREPHETLSFGKELTGECEAVYNEAMKDDKALQRDNNFVRDKVADCDPEAKAYIEAPYTRLPTLFGVMMMGLGYALMIYGLVAVVFICVAVAAFKLLLASWQCFKAMWPGTDTTAVFTTLATAALDICFVAVSGLFLAVSLMAAGKALTAFGAISVIKYRIMGSLFLVFLVMLLLFWRKVSKAGKAMSERVRSAMERSKAGSVVHKPQVVSRGATAIRNWTSSALSSTVGNRMGNSAITRNKPAPTPAEPVSTAKDSTTRTPVPGTSTNPAAPETAPAGPEKAPRSTGRAAVLRAGLMAAAKKHPVTAVAAKVVGNVSTAAQSAGTGKERAKAVAVQARASVKEVSDPEKRRSIQNQALRQQLVHQRAKNVAHHQEQQKKQEAAQQRQLAAQKRQQQRKLSNQVSRERANAPLFNAEHAKREQAARQRAVTATRQDRRAEQIRRRLAEGRFQQERLAQARHRAEQAQESVREPVKR